MCNLWFFINTEVKEFISENLFHQKVQSNNNKKKDTVSNKKMLSAKLLTLAWMTFYDPSDNF